MTAADIETFSVCQVLEGHCEWVRLGVSAEESVEAAHHYCNSIGAQLGFVEKVMITDADDYCCFLWERGKGVVFK